MTTIVDRPSGRRQIHALLIAVDEYPHCGTGARIPDEVGGFLADLGPLTCASASAAAVARWLLDGDDDQVALGSLEMVVSARSEVAVEVNGRPVRVGPATWKETAHAFDAWYARCDRHSDAVAMMFFWGHGCRMRREDILLLEDVGQSPGRPFENAIDFGRTYWGLRHCRAQTQCFFIDACRTDTEERLGTREIGARTLCDGPLWTPPRAAPVVYSTVAGCDAYGQASQPTRFTTAVLATLAGEGAAQQDNQRWVVRTEDLVRGVRGMMRWNHRDGDPEQEVSEGGQSGDAVVRVLPGRPRVPFTIGCVPDSALTSAHLALSNASHAWERPPHPEAWTGLAPASEYGVSARFPDGSFTDAEGTVLLYPPFRRFDLPVVRT